MRQGDDTARAREQYARALLNTHTCESCYAPDTDGPCYRCALNAVIEVIRRAEAAEQNAAFLRDSIGECHLMISRLDQRLAYHTRQDWDATSLPARLMAMLWRMNPAWVRTGIAGGADHA